MRRRKLLFAEVDHVPNDLIEIKLGAKGEGDELGFVFSQGEHLLGPPDLLPFRIHCLGQHFTFDGVDRDKIDHNIQSFYGRGSHGDLLVREIRSQGY